MKTEIMKIEWSHLKSPLSDIMALWADGLTYAEIARSLTGVTRGMVSGCVFRHRNDDHVVNPRGPLLHDRASARREKRPLGFNRVDDDADSRDRLKAALHVDLRDV